MLCRVVVPPSTRRTLFKRERDFNIFLGQRRRRRRRRVSQKRHTTLTVQLTRFEFRFTYRYRLRVRPSRARAHGRSICINHRRGRRLRFARTNVVSCPSFFAFPPPPVWPAESSFKIHGTPSFSAVTPRGERAETGARVVRGRISTCSIRPWHDGGRPEKNGRKVRPFFPSS